MTGKAMAKKNLTKDELRKIKQTLVQRRTQLTSNLKSGLVEIGNQEGHHLADLEDIDNIQDNDAVFEVVNNASASLEQIEKAIEKIDKGTYGTCEDCGLPISEERLKALPFAIQCIECRRKAELEVE
jgi:DnaK suppressor protein